MQHPKLVTLTKERWTGDPREGIKALRAQVLKIRRTSLFAAVKGGAYQIELKRKDDGRHIHIHLLLDAPYIPYQKLFTEWRRITKQKYVETDIRSAETEQARRYVVKYPSKSASFDTDPTVIVDWYEATKGLRLFATFGKWFNATISSLEPDTPLTTPGMPCPRCGERKTSFYVRDGPFYYGGELWTKVQSLFTPDGITFRDLVGVASILKAGQAEFAELDFEQTLTQIHYDENEGENGPL